MRSNHRRRSKLVRARRLRPLSSSMHRVVPGAYRPWSSYLHTDARSVSMHLLVPGAYRLEGEDLGFVYQTVSMHLLVPGAYRPAKSRDGNGIVVPTCLNAPSGAGCLPTQRSICSPWPARVSQCTFWCRVLTDLPKLHTQRLHSRSQCTFWCRVLTDPMIGVLRIVAARSQ